MKDTIYFCLDLTEDEHFMVEFDLKKLCWENNMELRYYRKVKTGHIPGIREVKIRFVNNPGPFFAYMKTAELWKHAKRWEDGKDSRLVEWTAPSQSEF